MTNKETTVKVGFPLVPIIFAIFLTLKLAGVGIVATWSWWWITSPLWIPFAFVAIVFAALGVVALIFRLYERFSNK